MPSPSPSRRVAALPTATAQQVLEFLSQESARVEASLRGLVAEAKGEDGGVMEAMRYTLLAGGKRIRPAALLATARVYHTPRERVLSSACAVEMIHAASLFLDDLPCMDDAELRRGKAANHRVFGEARAILAAFGLLNLAYQTVSSDSAIPETLRAHVAELLGQAVGIQGLTGGQALDLALDSTRINLDELERIHSRKTGSLFIASMEIGAVLSKAPEAERESLALFAKNLGLAYQIVDDLLDATGDSRSTGKTTGADRRGNFVSLAGIEGARRLVVELSDCALEQLASFGARAALLRGLALYLTDRAR
jgi:geranylgeranyl diphosphate synthase type II